MKTIILPGYSPHNKDWAYEVKKHLGKDVVVHEWRHWETGKSLSTKYETEKIKGLIGSEKVNIIAKSVGTRVMMALLPEINKQVNKVILCGIPVDPIKYYQGIKLLGAKRLLIIQNTHDPFTPSKIIMLYLKVVDKKIKVIEKEAHNHDYPYFSDFASFLGVVFVS
jgi:hypothetical protein